MRRLSDRIAKWSTGPVVLVGLAVFAVFIGWVLPDQATQAEAITGDAGSPDTSFFYTASELYDMADAYGEDGRAQYVRARYTFDVIWPIAYLLFLATAISWVFRRAFDVNSRLQLANLFPVAGVVFDYLENSAAAVVMARYPSTTPIVDALAGPFTALKWIFVQGSFVVLLGGLVVGAFRWLRNRGNPANGGTMEHDSPTI